MFDGGFDFKWAFIVLPRTRLAIFLHLLRCCKDWIREEYTTCQMHKLNHLCQQKQLQFTKDKYHQETISITNNLRLLPSRGAFSGMAGWTPSIASQ
jgi:hypothetical protein